MQQIIPPSSYFINAQVTEQHLLSWMLKSQSALDYVAPYLTEELFYDPKCKEIAKIFMQLIEEGEATSWQIVVARLNALEKPTATMMDVANLMSIPGSETAPLSSLLKTLDMYRRCRAMVELSRLMWITGTTEPRQEDQNKDIEQMMEMFDKIRLGIENPIIPLEESVAKNMETIRDNQDPETRHTGLLTGFHAIDQWGGLPLGLTVLGAKSSHGKSAMALTWALNAAKTGMKVAYFSFEMNCEELSARTMAMETRALSPQVSANAVMRMPLSAEQMQSTTQAVDRLRQAGCLQNFLLNSDLSSSYTRMEMQIRQLVNHSGVKAVFIDYLQTLGLSGRNNATREELLGQVAHRLHNLAAQLKIYIVALSQINRNVQGEPSMHHLRDSGQIAEAADSVVILWRPEQEHVTAYNEPHQSWSAKGTALFKLEKFRNGPTGDSLVKYTPQITLYEDIDPDDQLLSSSSSTQPKELLSPELFT